MIHKLTNIHPEAKIGANVTIESFTTIYENVEIGEGTWIGSNVTIMSGARIGKNCRIFPGAVISAIPQDLKFEGEETTAEIGDNTTIRECVTVNRGTKDKHKTVIGQNCLIMAYVHVAHDCALGNHCILSNAVQLAGHVEVDDYALLAGTSAVHQFVKIGKYAMIPGGALVRKDVPPYLLPAGNPLAYRGLNNIGLQRRGFSPEQIGQIRKVYEYIFLKGMNTTQAVTYIEANVEKTTEVLEILNFIKRADRGIIRS